MTKVVCFQSSDGSLFPTEKECLAAEYAVLFGKVSERMKSVWNVTNAGSIGDLELLQDYIGEMIEVLDMYHTKRESETHENKPY